MDAKVEAGPQNSETVSNAQERELRRSSHSHNGPGVGMACLPHFGHLYE